MSQSDAAALLTLAEAPLDAFVAAIGSVSPTRLPLAPEEKAARYQLKAQLQARAIELHGAVLTVRRAGVGVIGLGRRDGGRGDLGHAPLARLSAAARRWALAQLGEKPAGATTTSHSKTSGATTTSHSKASSVTTTSSGPAKERA